ncbi:DUF3037 domain-containing protein [Chromobacterium haemolyticum]|uniref:DUF3037 domain-containing protein n=1 Tax=Chromobacterium haemolyticum TaxID=394935 RepID=UPI0017476516|nr:DUF3037 domain-containing protein [Chromobacterium haemolyticum]QOD84837.1 DUF3037 domain-containing protein [Chromobacterium haemolyticum]
MKKRTQYSYSVLRYVHDIKTGEFVNVGVVVYAPEDRFIKALFRSSFSRVTGLFPSVYASNLRKLVSQVKYRFDEISDQTGCGLAFSQQEKLEEILRQVVIDDDSSLKWSDISYGISSNIESMPFNLFNSLVVKYDTKTHHQGKSDDDIWRCIKRDLKSRKIEDYFREKTVKSHGDDDGLLFKHAWKNGKWHFLEPISFDLSAKESIRDKAYKHFGQYVSVADAKEKFKIYLLVGKPSNDQLNEAFDSAVSLLKKLPIENEVIFDDQFGKLAQVLADQVKSHESELA